MTFFLKENSKCQLILFAKVHTFFRFKKIFVIYSKGLENSQSKLHDEHQKING